MLKRMVDTLRTASIYCAILGAVFSGASGDPALLVNGLRVWAVMELIGIFVGPAPMEPGQSFSAARLNRRERGHSD